jgi:hypothetical protein
VILFVCWAGKTYTAGMYARKDFYWIMELNIKQAIDFTKRSKSTIYSKINSGELSKNSNGMLDTSELLRVFGSPKNKNEQEKQSPLDNKKNFETEVNYLQKQVASLEKNLSEAKEREQWLQNQVASVTDAIKLLDFPKSEITTIPDPEKSTKTLVFLVLAIVFGILVVGLSVALGVMYLKYSV